MKYVIRFRLPLDASDYMTYVKGFQWTDHRATPSIDWTPHLHEAITYKDISAAVGIQHIIERRVPSSDARVIGITDKELFKAKLAHK